jgi:MFS family permease
VQNTLRIVIGVVLAALAMSLGWGIRGDYGHEAGAMIPGALLGLSICLASGREDWWRRASLMGMCGAIGWAFGGQMSYARITGYTASSSLPDVFYGYACLFVIGGLWAGIGSAILALSVTRPATYLERFARPLVALWLVWFAMGLSGLTSWLSDRWSLNDTDWVGAASALAVAGVWTLLFPSDRSACGLIAVLAGGWWVGYLILTALLGLHMTPPRSDNWAGCVGLFAALLTYLHRQQDRTAGMLAGYGFWIGGIGFVLGNILNMLGRAQWGPIGRYEVLHSLDYWKWMEQSFGLIMGLGVGAAFLGWVGPRLAPPVEEGGTRRLRLVALVLLLIVMMWANLSKNVRNWTSQKQIPGDVLGLNSRWWLLLIGLLLSATVVVALLRHGRRRLALSPAADFGRGQLLFLLITWVSVLGAFTQALPGMSGRGVFLVHASFWITAGLGSLIAVCLPPEAEARGVDPRAASDVSWPLRRGFWITVLLTPIILYCAARLTVAAHDRPLPGSTLRFAETFSPN